MKLDADHLYVWLKAKLLHATLKAKRCISHRLACSLYR